MYTEVKVGETLICQCRQWPQSAERILQTCPNLATLRHSFRPEPITLTEKLYGTSKHLTKTAELAKATELQIGFSNGRLISFWFSSTASDLRLSAPPPDQGAGGGARTRVRWGGLASHCATDALWEVGPVV
ncbi:hypothetical protein PoB_004881600 [Plakobranchus ocellatus]|uniref:Uncharacterized protein n=1 Tax=Plakobranchus ocellatus TaxID=259542 RepID=A0AAV4BPC5_9GAST|nr:hypothetical protein PoB_004881600 [Plakobranchus ocellatus]